MIVGSQLLCAPSPDFLRRQDDARTIAQNAFHMGIDVLDDLVEDDYQAATPILQLKENLCLVDG